MQASSTHPQNQDNSDMQLIDQYFHLMNFQQENRGTLIQEVQPMPWFNTNEPIKQYSLLKDVEYTTSTSLTIE